MKPARCRTPAPVVRPRSPHESIAFLFALASVAGVSAHEREALALRLLSAVGVLTSGADPQPLSGAWS